MELKKKTDFSSSLKSFLGYLEGTEKSKHTIQSYKLDLLAFQKFIEQAFRRPIPIDQISLKDLDHYHSHLKQKGLKTNTRRRMLMTVRKFLSYLNKRKKIPMDLGRKLLTPHKIERIPVTISYAEWMGKVLQLKSQTPLQARNRLLLWFLAETGCLVSEVGMVKFSHFEFKTVRISGKSERVVGISDALAAEAQRLHKTAGKSDYVFLGFNKFGSLGGPISSRGVELALKTLAHQLGFPKVTPRTLRHSVVAHWFAEGIAAEEIQKRLGLKSQYAFRAWI